jgi:subtilisin family serine protease
LRDGNPQHESVKETNADSCNAKTQSVVVCSQRRCPYPILKDSNNFDQLISIKSYEERHMKRNILYAVMALVLVFSNASAVFAQDGGPDRTAGRELPASVEELRLETPVTATGLFGNVLDSSLVGAEGPSKVIIRLSADSGAGAYDKGNDEGKAKNNARTQQDAFIKSVRQIDPNARLLGQVQLVMNAVFVEVDASVLPQLALDSRVVRIAPVGDYQIDLSETVPYIGAAAVQAKGITGKGIKVAVLDSGIDYTHAAFGGSGNPAVFDANDPTIIERKTFPTKKVVGGYDFVGEAWEGGAASPPLAPDPDPLDKGDGAGHGTHVAHIIGGVGGVAPGVSLYAVGVCSKVSTACSGIALIQGMEFAVDPNGDGRVKDRVDIVNMSLGSLYGQPFDDDLSTAVDNATKLGVLTVAAAGNGADKPYVTDTPGSAPTALSVAQTNVPSAVLALMQVIAPASIVGEYPAVFQPWSVPLTSVIEAPVQYGDGVGGNLDGCAAFTAGSLTGKIVLVDRGACNFSLKISNISVGGGLVGIIGLIASGDPFEGADGGDRPIDIPGYMITLANADILRSGLPDTVVRFDPNVGIALVGSMVGSSSRGPQHEDTTLIKPEIGAPGSSVSAIYGTGTGTGPFGGTSGATPMVAGSAALLLDAYNGGKSNHGHGDHREGMGFGNGLTPLEVKALLMNNAETNIINDVLLGDLAPITRIGGGEVRVDQALAAPVLAFDKNVPTAALGFGFVDVADGVVTLKKTVVIRNIDNKRHTYSITPIFRFADDEANGAVTVSAPEEVVVKPGRGKDTKFNVTLTINGALLNGNYMNSGSNGANPAVLTLNEYDGYLLFDDGRDQFQMPWHVLPRKDARVVPDTTTIIPESFPQVIGLDNTGVGTAQNDAYALIAVSDDLPEGGMGQASPTPDLRAVGINTFTVPAGFCSDDPSFLWAFAINTWERQQHLVPVEYDIYLDTNQDGGDDYVVFNFDNSLSGSLSDGRQVTWAADLATGDATAFFFAEHSTNTGNTVLLVCGEQIGLSGADILATSVNMRVEAVDWYNGGPGDVIDGLTVTPLGEQYFGAPIDVPGNTYDPAALEVYDYGSWPGNTPELGLMLLTNGDRGTGARGGATQDTEALLFTVP